MVDRDVTSMLDRAAGSGELPLGLTERVIARARSRRRRLLAASTGALAVVALLGGVLVVPRINPGTGGPGGPPDTAASVPLTPGQLTGLSRAAGAPVTEDQIIAVGNVGGEILVAVRREARLEERAAGGRAAEIFIDSDDGTFRRASDYLSYDFGCVDGDAVCAAVRSTGLGLFVIRRQPGGRVFVLAQAPKGRQVQVVAQGRAYPAGTAEFGTVVELEAPRPDGQLEVWVTMADGRRYRIPEAPGAMITG